ncbi:MAG: response regulator [bacterium]|nr:response regulator [bacterium]
MAPTENTDTGHIEELNGLANAELARRSLRVSFIFIPVTLLVAKVTGLHQSAPKVVLAYLVMFLIFGLLRTIHTRDFEKRHKKNPDAWLRQYVFLTIGPALALGASIPLVYMHKGAGWDLIVCMMSLTGISAGATASLSARFKIFRLFQVIVLGPSIITLAFFASGKEQALSFLVILFLAQVMVLGRYFHKEFWSGLINQHELKIRAKSLEEANIKAQQAVKIKGEFLANMSHEIRTPLNGIIGLTDLVLESELNEQQHDYLSDVKISGETLLTIINEILDFSKIEAGGIVIEKRPFSLSRVLDKTIRPLRFSAESKANTLVVELDNNLPRKLKGDSHRLWQILTNLAGNAVKFTENGTITVKASLEGRSGDVCSVRLDVKDTGIGISKAAQETIFDAFSQADGSTTRNYGGTGLGLAISKKLVELMGGELVLNSEENKGSTFSFILEMKEVSEAKSQKIPKTKKNLTPQLSGLNILLVEDNSVNAKLATRLLNKSDIQVEWVTDGSQAVEAFQKNSYDIVLMDVQMPVMDGFEATQNIRKYEKGTGKQTPIIALTAHALDGYRELCLEKGMDDYLTKPLNPKILRETLSIWVPVEKNQVEPQSV